MIFFNDDPNRRLRRERMVEARRKGMHTKEQWETLKAFCQFECARCGAWPVCKDHIQPICAGGSDHIENIQPLCVRCNSRKDVRDQLDYRPDGWREAVYGAVQ